MKRALICGVFGQHDANLARFLLDRGYEVFGTSREASTSHDGNLKSLAAATESPSCRRVLTAQASLEHE
ncbi:MULTISPECIES: GDP-mannose 4,6-dehydratase [Burkholderia]|uniref:GDP-mannose 4,6-dehydratase n=1 Tax=Burkholderia TaxID=32008 RepID=UPI0012F7BCCD|nr:GDP-mannose 4,6-dehydratase [Burkholderia humptydooensis]